MKSLQAACFAALCLATPLTGSAAIDSAIESILKVGSEGAGNEAASGAWKSLSQSPVEQIPDILSRMQDANPISANYLRTAVQAIVDRELAGGKELPVAALGDILMDVRQDAGARSLAFDLIRQAHPETAEKLVPGFLSDPSNDLRREAVQRLIDQAAALPKDDPNSGAVLVYRQALNGARDVDQIDAIAKALREMDQEVDLPRHFGFLMHWKTIAPFDNTGRAGFDEVYPPENEVKLDATYDGKSDQKVGWQDVVTTDEYGVMDLNKPHGFLKDVVGYAWTEFESATDQQVELRLGCKNAWKVWLNGELLFGRDEYHRGKRIDQYKMEARMKAGTNTILVKCCQNEQEYDWTVQWDFQLRVCDSTGTAILSENRPPTPKPEAARRRPAQP